MLPDFLHAVQIKAYSPTCSLAPSPERNMLFQLTAKIIDLLISYVTIGTPFNGYDDLAHQVRSSSWYLGLWTETSIG